MTDSERKLCKVILEALHDMDGRQLTALQLHAEGQVRRGEKISVAEFDRALELAQTRGWIVGVTSKFGGLKFNATDAGEAALLEMA